MICQWAIPCDKPKEPGEDYCNQHCKALGIKPKKEKKVYSIPKVSEKKKSAQPADKDRKKRLAEFYDSMLNKAPSLCENCQQPLINSTWINPRTICAHVLSKSKFPTVETNEYNILFLCAGCHSRYDLQTEWFMKESKLAHSIKNIVAALLPLIPLEQHKSIPEYLV